MQHAIESNVNVNVQLRRRPDIESSRCVVEVTFFENDYNFCASMYEFYSRDKNQMLKDKIVKVMQSDMDIHEAEEFLDEREGATLSRC
jgi:hypothetical protein